MNDVYTGSIFIDLIVLLVLMFLFARHEADWEPTTARSGVFFYYLNPKAIIVFLPQFALCRLLMSWYWGFSQVLILLLFFLPLTPLLHRFFYVPWRKALLIAGCFLGYMMVIAVAIHKERAADEEASRTGPVGEFLQELERSREEGESSP